jgi:hypothetical protein
MRMHSLVTRPRSGQETPKPGLDPLGIRLPRRSLRAATRSGERNGFTTRFPPVISVRSSGTMESCRWKSPDVARRASAVMLDFSVGLCDAQ